MIEVDPCGDAKKWAGVVSIPSNETLGYVLIDPIGSVDVLALVPVLRYSGNSITEIARVDICGVTNDGIDATCCEICGEPKAEGVGVTGGVQRNELVSTHPTQKLRRCATARGRTAC